FAAEDHGAYALGDVFHGRVVDGQAFAAGLVNGFAALEAAAVGIGRDHEILDAHIGEGASHHDFVVAPARTIAIEVGLGYAVLFEPHAGRRGFFDGAGRGYVVGGDRVAEDGQGARVGDRWH